MNSDVLDQARAGGGTSRAGLLLAALACVLGLGLSWLVFVGTPAGQRVDQYLLPEYGQQSVLTGPARFVLSYPYYPMVLVAVLAVVLVAGAHSGRLRLALAGAAVVGCTILAARVLKTLLPRPDLGVAGSATHNSFPSGHVAAGAAVVCAVLLVLPGWARWWWAVTGAVAVLAVGAATMILGWHRLSDVAGAVFLAAVFGCVAAWFTGERWREV